MKTEKLEDIKMYTGIILLGEIFMVTLGVGPAIILWIQRKPIGEYSSGLMLSEYVAIILIFTLMAYLLMIRELKKRHSEAAFFLGGIRLILSFLFQRENKKEHIGESTVINFKQSSIVRHFSVKVNKTPFVVFLILSVYLSVAVYTLVELFVHGKSMWVRAFDKRYDPNHPEALSNIIFMMIIILLVVILDIAALIRIKVSTNGLKEDIIDSKIPLSVLEEEFKKSANIGHDIWVGEEHIFLSAGRESYMFRKDKIFDIRCERVMWNWRLFFLPVYRIIITGEGGIRQASFFTLRKGVYERLKNAVE